MMGDINLDFYKEKRFQYMTYGAAAIGAVTGVITAGASSSLGLAGVVAIGAVTGGIALPVAIMGGVGLAYTGAKTLMSVAKGFNWSSRQRAKSIYGKTLRSNMFVYAALKGLKSFKTNGGTSLAFTAIIGINTFKALFIAPVQTLKTAVTGENKAATRAPANKAPAPKVKITPPKQISAKAEAAFQQQPKQQADNHKPSKKQEKTNKPKR